MPKITELPALTVPGANDPLAIVDSSGAITKRITRNNLLSGAALPANTVDAQAIASNSVTTAKINAGAVTPEKRSGGFYIGSIPGSTVGSTGNKAITGVGFVPKLVKFIVKPSSNNTTLVHGMGAMTSTSQYCVAIAQQASASRNSSSSACIGWITAGASAFTLLASYVSMDSDGFTINVSAASSSFDIAFEAYA